MGDIDALSVAEFLNEELLGKNLLLSSVSSLNSAKKYSLMFSKKNSFHLNVKCLILVPYAYRIEKEEIFSIIKVKNPRLSFAKVVAKFFVNSLVSGVDKSSMIGEGCDIDTSVTIGKYCIIGNNVTIGENSILNHNIVIHDNSVIGADCYLKSGTVIGEDGFGFDFEEDGVPIRLPHLGRVVIGNSVEIGAKNTIARGTLDNTIIHNNVKIDDQVHIAHNCEIGENTIITACSEISGSVTIGKQCWIAPNCSILQKIKIGDNVTIGIGSIVTKDIESNKKVMGFESLELRPLLKVKKRIEYGK